MHLFEPFVVLHLPLSKAIPISWLTVIGLLGNALFTGRVLIQWMASERQGRSVVPVAFWWLSLFAASVLIVYSLANHDEHGLPDPDVPFFLGLSVSVIPYFRNLRIHYYPDRPARGGWQVLIPAALLMGVVAVGSGVGVWVQLNHNKNHPAPAVSHPPGAAIAADSLAEAPTAARPHFWLLFCIGLLGNIVYSSRFVVAWIHAESERKAVLPLSFWYISTVGSLICLVYALMRGNIVFILSFLFNTIPYLRNIALMRRAAAKVSS